MTTVSRLESSANELSASSARSSMFSSFLGGVAAVLSGQAAVALLGLGIEICYARLIGPAGRGLVSLCMMAVAVCSMLGGLGGKIPIISWSANGKRRFEDWFPAVCLMGIAGSVVSVCIWEMIYWRWHPPFLRGVTPTLAAIVAGTVPISIAFEYLLALFTSREKFRMMAGLTLVSQVAEFLSISILLLAIRRSVEMALLGNAMGVLIAVLASAFVLRSWLRGWWKLDRSAKAFLPALSLGVRGEFGNLATLVSYRLDVFVVNLFLGPTQLGLYALGVVASESLWQVPSAVAVVLFPRTARTLETGAEKFTCQITRQILLLAAIMGLLLAVASPIAIPLIFGTRFGPSIGVIWWILPGTIALSTSKVLSADITARGRPELNSMVALLGAAVTIILDFALIPRMGIRGAALVSSVTYFLEGVLIAGIATKLLGVSWRKLLIPVGSDFLPYQDIWQKLLSKLNLAAPQANSLSDDGSFG